MKMGIRLAGPSAVWSPRSSRAAPMQEKKELESLNQPINCATAEDDCRVLQNEKPTSPRWSPRVSPQSRPRASCWASSPLPKVQPFEEHAARREQSLHHPAHGAAAGEGARSTLSRAPELASPELTRE
jgi:hypothetical protein